MKVWTFRDGMDIVATPVTRGRHPNLSKLSESKRVIGRARSTNGALADLATQLGVGATLFEISPLEITTAEPVAA